MCLKHFQTIRRIHPCRVGELLALTSEDIDFENGTVNISKTYYRRNQTDYVTPPKTESSNRKITIPKFLAEEMKDFVDRQYGLTPEDQIFPITDRAIQKKMKQKTEQAKLKPIRVHDLRHSHIALLIEKGMQPLVIAQRVGHDSVNTTMNIYGHLYPNKQKFLKEHRPARYQYLLMTGKLTEHLNAVDQEARGQIEALLKQMSKQLVVTEELKSKNQMEWVRKMNNIKSAAEEIVLKRIIYECSE